MDSIDARIAAAASAQRGRLSTPDFDALGVSDDSLRRRHQAGRVIRKHRGFYAVGHDAGDIRADWVTATQIGGDDSSISHLPCLNLRGLIDYVPPTIDVTIRRDRRPRDGIVWHRDQIADDERDVIDGIRCTSAVRALRDCAPLLDRDTFEKVWDRADDTEQLRFDPITLDEILARYPRHPGARIIRAYLKDRATDKTRSWLERHFRKVTKGLPKPQRNHKLTLRRRTIEADCFYELARLIVELDGRTYHARRAALESDTARDAAAAAVGYRTMRITWMRLRDEPDLVRADLIDALAYRPAA